MKIIKIDKMEFKAREVFKDLTLAEFIHLNNKLLVETDPLEYKFITINYLSLIPEEILDNIDTENFLNIFQLLTEDKGDILPKEFKGFKGQDFVEYEEIKITRKQYSTIKENITLNFDWLKILPKIFFTNEGVEPDDKISGDFPIDVILPYIFKTLQTMNLNIKLDVVNR